MFPGSCPPSIFSAEKLNYCVRNGNRCDLLAITTRYRRNQLCSFSPFGENLTCSAVAPQSIVFESK